MISTHVLDTSLGKPAVGISVTLSLLQDGQMQTVASGLTDDDGRVPGWLDDVPAITAGTYCISFVLDSYFMNKGQEVFYPKAEIVFNVADPEEHFHIPLLLNPFGYSTYRGS